MSGNVSKLTSPQLDQIFYACCLWPKLGHPMTSMQYVLLVLWMTSYFPIMAKHRRHKYGSCWDWLTWGKILYLRLPCHCLL